MHRSIVSIRACTSSLLIVIALTSTAAATDPFLGTWKLNIPKSKFDGPPPKSSTATITAVGDKRKLTVHTVPANGPELNTESIAADDGKDYPMKGSPTVDTVSVVRLDGRTIERRDKKNGNVVATLRATVSADGRTMTIVQRGMNPRGQAYANTLVYDRVPQK
jgi:hypothetical protein